jgi:hypothetical protein
MGFEREVKAITTLNSENGATLYTGYIKVPADGEYTFSLLTSNASLLRIHDCTVIDNDYVFEDGVERSGTIMLKAGLHPFKLTCLQKTKKKNLLSLTWSSKSIIKTQIPKTNLFCDK